MAIDLHKGISLEIEGELGKFQTLPIESLIKIAESLQELILSIAKYDLPANEAIDLNNFKLELTDFQKGSAIPSFVLTQRVQPVITSDYQNQREEVTKRLNTIFEISDKGNYADLKVLYPEHFKRNEIVEKLYGFTSSFKNSPVSIYEKGNINEESAKYRPKKFKASTKKSLIVKIEEVTEEQQEEKAFARIKVTKKGGKTRKRIEEVISTAQHSLSYSPEIINVNKKQYILNFPLRCLFEKEEDYYVINNEQLDIIGTGETQDDAEKNFNEEFDYLYNRLNSLNDNQLNKRLLRIKNVLNSFVKEVF
ncbi:hypothetical protein [Flagellimonas aequoris]|uniref:Uncharacterized protein n=1 Tax=Flagellimonas aequoris TaxID=2306997 RepID=A0A418NA78_9FLAO|nr:hypothetical protein [Allomuricauda aequoris]RIV72544.1 hypothetical protein D2U88_04730 [Allomuricauda aequoris]TXK05045.1 hypothetical protein FQ019_04700 [Allomuricauda aequoris]